MNDVKRIIIRDAVGVKLSDLVDDLGDTAKEVAVIYGVASKVESKQAQGGTFTYNLFKGDFKAVSHVTGEEICAPSMYLPDPADTELECQLGKNSPVEFAYLISMKKADNKYGYDLVTKRLIEYGKNVFSGIENKIDSKFLPQMGKKPAKK